MIRSIQRNAEAVIDIIRPSIGDKRRTIIGEAARRGWNIGDTITIVLQDAKIETYDLIASPTEPFAATRMS